MMDETPNLSTKRVASDGTASATKRSRQLLHGGSEDPAHSSANANIAGGVGRWRGLDAYQRHKLLINQYLLSNPGSITTVLKRDTSNDVHDIDIVKRHYRFIMVPEDDAGKDGASHASAGEIDPEYKDELSIWEKKVALKYYKRLHQEYCIVDLALYKTNNVGMRWRTEREVVDGKGQFICGSRKCMVRSSAGVSLQSWEVNFAYSEKDDAGGVVKKNALVKVRLCEECSAKLNYNKQHRRYLRSDTQNAPKCQSPIDLVAHCSSSETAHSKQSGVGETHALRSRSHIDRPAGFEYSPTSHSTPQERSSREKNAEMTKSGVDAEHASEKLMRTYLDDLLL